MSSPSASSSSSSPSSSSNFEEKRPPNISTRSPLLSGVSITPSPTQLTPPHTPRPEDITSFNLNAPQEDNLCIPPRVKIVCTIGPASQSKDKLKALLLGGMNVIRLNTKHGDHSYHLTTLNNLREVMNETRRICATLIDLKGPEIRTGKLADDKEVEITKGQEFTLVTDESVLGDNKHTAVRYPNLPKMVKKGHHILIGDGLIDLMVVDTDAEAGAIRTIAQCSGLLGSNKNVNVPGVPSDLPSVTQKDVNDMMFAVENSLDFIAASFVRKAADIQTIRKILGQKGSAIKIIAKIESQEGLDNFEEILRETDGIMVARGDLGVEIPIEQVAIAQKMMIHKCNAAGKFVITATQMMESMIKNPSPTRAEASDVANAVLDGSDCVMLSGETAKGAYPVECVKTMVEIIREAESHISYQASFQQIRDLTKGAAVSIPEAIASSAVRATFDLGAAIVIVLTETGSTARLVSKYRPRAPIITVTSNEQTARQALVSRGLFPLLVGSMVGSDSLINRVILACQRLGMCKIGDLVVVTSGSREGVSGATNDLKVIQINY